MKHSLFLLLIFMRLKSKRALSQTKKANKTKTKNIPCHARTGNEFLAILFNSFIFSAHIWCYVRTKI